MKTPTPDTLLNFLVGQVLRIEPRANIQTVRKMLLQRLESTCAA